MAPAISLESILNVFRAHGDHRQQALIRELKKRKRQTFPLVQSIATGPYPPSVQRWAMEALVVYPPKQVLPILRRALRNPHMTVRLHAMMGISQLGDPRLARYIRPLLHDASGGIRVNALAVLGEMKPPWLAQVLKESLSDKKAYVRHLAKKLLDKNE